MRTALRHLGRLRDREDGSATVEFVLLLPIYFVLLVNCFELGMIMLRQTMLDRSIDMVVRDIRVGIVDFGTAVKGETEAERARRQHDILKDLICGRSGFLANCDDALKLEMQVVDPRSWTGLSADIDCIDQQDVSLPPRQFSVGQGNDLVMLRACHIFRPMIEDFGLGTVLGDLLASGVNGHYKVISTSSYMIEPEGSS